MQAHEQTQFLQAVGSYVREQIQISAAPLLGKIAELERQIIECRARNENMLNSMASAGRDLRIDLEEKIANIPAGKDGKDGRDGLTGKDGADGRDGSAGIDGKNGKDCDFEALIVAMTEEVHRICDLIPVPQNGKDGKDGRDGIDGKDGADGRDGLSVDADELNQYIDSSVAAGIARLPVPAVPASIIGGHIDRDGNLWHSFSNGTLQKMGLVVGRDGKDIDPYLAEAKLREMFDKWPKPRDGIDGKDGRDGFGFDQFDIECVDDRLYLVFRRDDEVRKFLLPHIHYRGVWKEGEYLVGDCVTYDGSQFIARQSTETEPMTKDNDWQLCVKRGRDGKQGERGLPGKDGKDGRPGRDLTQMGHDGSKW